jgi:hypothetical protein
MNATTPYLSDIDPSGLAWRKSSYSMGNGGECVEIAETASCVLVRDSKDVEGPMLTFSSAGWAAFVVDARNGEFDRP